MPQSWAFRLIRIVDSVVCVYNYYLYIGWFQGLYLVVDRTGKAMNFAPLVRSTVLIFVTSDYSMHKSIFVGYRRKIQSPANNKGSILFRNMNMNMIVSFVWIYWFIITMFCQILLIVLTIRRSHIICNALLKFCHSYDKHPITLLINFYVLKQSSTLLSYSQNSLKLS